MQQQVVLEGCKHAFCFACLKEWQTHSTNTGSFDTEDAAMSCPYCRQDIEKSVVQDTMEKAFLYTARAKRLQEKDPDRKKYFELALAEVNKILVTDERDLDALCLKCHILRYNAPEDAIQAYERLLELDREGSANLEIMEAMMDKVQVALDSGDDDEADRLMGPVEAYHALGKFVSKLGSGPRRLFAQMADFAEAHEAVGNWEEARAIYHAMMKETIDDDPETTDEDQNCMNHMIYRGSSRCMYQLGFYDNAIATGELALAMNRLIPGVHKLIALPQLALGQVEAARTTMRRGVVYEAPWDNVNRHKNIAFLEDCLRDETNNEGV
jgi:tetratricopeptide (TPR) repeat protein